jgi:subtilisin family serine protease
MSAIKKSSIVLLCLALAIACLVGVLTIIDASSVRANQNEVPQPASTIQSTIIISPTGLQAVLYPDEQLTLTLWITNKGVSPITYTIYEMTATPGLAGFSLLPTSSPVIDPDARSLIDALGAALVIIHLREQPDLSPAYNIADRAPREQYVYDRLLETASHSVELYRWLESQGTYPYRLLTANAIAATLNSSQLDIVAANPQVMQVTGNRQYQIIPAVTTPLVGPLLPQITSVKPDMVEWNIAKIRANQAWSIGITGTGAVVAIMDTGVMYDHPALVKSYRGNLGDFEFDHNYNWFDFVENGQNVPYDPVGHGTMGAGIISGDDGAGNQIGVAPGAKWIAVRACNYSCSDADLLAAFDWLLAPTDLSGANPRPDKRPDIVLGMWGGGGCNTFFQSNLNALRAAGILPVFPPGGSGPSCSSVGSPAALDQALAAGATDETDNIAPFSARGPGCGGIIKPDLSAPGVNVRTSTADPGYGITSGTSWSAAHAAGAAALVFSSNPSLGPDAVEDILFSTALCLNAPPPSCEGDNLCPGANNAYGHGRIDAFEAVSATLRALAPDILPWLSETPISGTLDVSETVAITVTFDASRLGVGVYTGTLVVESNDPHTPSITLPVSLTVYTPCEPIADLTVHCQCLWYPAHHLHLGL